VDESPILRGDFDEDSEDKFEPAPTLDTAATVPRDLPYPSSHQDLSREDVRQPRPTLISSLPPAILDKGRKTVG
jgi:hypothetical protein